VQTTLFAVLVMALLGVSGLTIDGGQLFVARRDTQALADGAARAGAGQLDEVAARLSPEDPPRIDPVAAADAANTYIGDVLPGATLAVLEVDGTHISVEVTSPPVSVTLLQLAGVGRTVRVQAIGAATPQTGITEPGQ
jgi:Flp pilus assembly protein TadG